MASLLGGKEIYAIVRTGGKQFRVEAGQTLDVPSVSTAVGERLELSDVLMVGEGNDAVFDSAGLDKAKVIAEVLSHGRTDKITVFKYKSKVRYRKKTGHRQPYSRLVIREVLTGSEAETKPAPRRRSPRTSATPPTETRTPAEEGE
jgi:large subunit ribosomal protein L21